MGIRNKLRTIDSRNVVAKLEGSDPVLKDEYVVYSAHWDHLGVGAPVNGDTIYNGALDNATGVATVLEIAKALKQAQPQPKRSFLFLMVTAEEKGLLGSEYYSLNPLYPLAKTVAEHQHRRHQPVGPDQGHLGRRPRGLGSRRLPAAGGAGTGADDHARPEPEKGFYYRSDHFNFAKQGVPALDPDSGVEYIGKSRRVGQDEARRIHGEGLPRAVGPGEARLGSERRRRRRAAADGGRLPRRERRQASRVEAGQRVQSEARRNAEEITATRAANATDAKETKCHIQKC